MFEHVLDGLVKSGWVLIPLALASVAGWFVVFRRLIGLRRLDWRRNAEWRKSLASGDHSRFLAGLSRRDRSTLAGSTLVSVYQARQAGREAMEARLDEALKFGIPELEKSLSTLAILASAAPLMGLLGTVSGIVRTFQVISAFGTGNQAMMSDSIAESLLATQNGLLVAFPLLLMHVYLTSRAEAIEKGTRFAAQSLINRCAPCRPAFAPRFAPEPA